MPRCPLLPSLNGNESSTQQALSLVRRSLPLPVVGFLFSSALSSLPSAHAELSSGGRSLLHQDGGQWARGQGLSTPAPSCARSQEQRANREQQSHQQSHQRGDTSEQRVLPFKWPLPNIWLDRDTRYIAPRITGPLAAEAPAGLVSAFPQGSLGLTTSSSLPRNGM